MISKRTLATLALALAVTGCSGPAATSKDKDPGSVEFHKLADGECVVRVPGYTPRDLDVNCVTGTVHIVPDTQQGSNWLQWGLAALGVFKLSGL